MDVWRNISRCNSKSDVPPETIWAFSLSSVTHERVSCSSRSYICVLRIILVGVRYLVFGLALFFGVVFVFLCSILCSTVARVS